MIKELLSSDRLMVFKHIITGQTIESTNLLFFLCPDVWEYLGYKMEKCIDIEDAEKKLNIYVDDEGIRFGKCFISHEAITEARGTLVKENYKEWVVDLIKKSGETDSQPAPKDDK